MLSLRAPDGLRLVSSASVPPTGKAHRYHLRVSRLGTFERQARAPAMASRERARGSIVDRSRVGRSVRAFGRCQSEVHRPLRCREEGDGPQTPCPGGQRWQAVADRGFRPFHAGLTGRQVPDACPNGNSSSRNRTHYEQDAEPSGLGSARRKRPVNPSCTFQTELRNVIVAMFCLSEIAADKGDPVGAQILGSVAELLTLKTEDLCSGPALGGAVTPA